MRWPNASSTYRIRHRAVRSSSRLFSRCAMPHAESSFAWSRSARECVSGRGAKRSAGALPIAIPCPLIGASTCGVAEINTVPGYLDNSHSAEHFVPSMRVVRCTQGGNPTSRIARRLCEGYSLLSTDPMSARELDGVSTLQPRKWR